MAVATRGNEKSCSATLVSIDDTEMRWHHARTPKSKEQKPHAYPVLPSHLLRLMTCDAKQKAYLETFVSAARTF
jgi:hypothetical protein